MTLKTTEIIKQLKDDSLKKKKKRNCFWEAAEGAGKLRNWPPMENRKAVPLIKSSRLPLHLQRWEPS